MNDSRIVIVGFMGCGKTAVARELALLRNERWTDLDERIEKIVGRNPAQIIIDDGETVFRELETRVLRDLLSANGEQVIALGGGAWTIAVNREILREHGMAAIWLDAPFELCWERIEENGQARPLAPTREVAQKLYSDRRPIYSLADLHVSVADESPIAIAERIAELLRQQPHT
jgi:shikimate kinase